MISDTRLRQAHEAQLGGMPLNMLARAYSIPHVELSKALKRWRIAHHKQMKPTGLRQLDAAANIVLKGP